MSLAAMNALISVDGGPGVGDQRLGRAVVLAELGQHPADHLAAALGVVGRERPAGEGRPPELAGDHVHLALDAVGLGLGLREHLVGREPGVELELELLANFSLPIRQSSVDRGQDLVLQERQVAPRGPRRSPRPVSPSSPSPLRLAREGEELVLCRTRSPPSVWLDRRLDLHPRRVADRRAGDLDHLGDLRHPRQARS